MQSSVREVGVEGARRGHEAEGDDLGQPFFGGKHSNAARRKKLGFRWRKEVSDREENSGSDYTNRRSSSADGWRTEIERSPFCRNSSSGRDTSSTDSDISLSMSSSSSSSDLERNLVTGVASSLDKIILEDPCVIPSRSHGSVSVLGRRREMEDAVTVVPGIIRSGAGDSGSVYDFFAVYDGHGGSAVADACRNRLHLVLDKEIESRGRDGGSEVKWMDIFTSCFSKMDDEIRKEAEAAGDTVAVSEAKTVGSTAVVALVGAKDLIVANCGDSRAVLSRGGVALPLSCDHKADRADEIDRIEAAGGKIINWDGLRVFGVLATSRSLGDHYLKPYVISEPEVVVSERTELDEFLILGSDGLWDVVSNKMACNVVRRCLFGRSSKGWRRGSAADAAALLVELAMGRGSSDNISVIVVKLSRSKSNAPIR